LPQLIDDDAPGRGRQLSGPVEAAFYAACHEAEFLVIANDHVACFAGTKQNVGGDLRGGPGIGSIIYVEKDRQTGRACIFHGPERGSPRRLGGKDGARGDHGAEPAVIDRVHICLGDLKIRGAVAVDDVLKILDTAFVNGKRSAKFSADRAHIPCIDSIIP